MSHSVSHPFSGPLMGGCHTTGYYPKALSHISPVDHVSSHRVHHTSNYAPHRGTPYRAISLNEGRKKVSFSSHSTIIPGHRLESVHGGHGTQHKRSLSLGALKDHGLLSINEKETMQCLNERLESYLKKVQLLEQENAELERKICEFQANNAPSSLPDTNQYLKTIQELQSQVYSANMDNARIFLQIDNAQLAADDLKIKYEMELTLRSNTEADVDTLRRGLGDLNTQLQDLEVQVQCLQEELLQLKNNHEEEINSLRAQLGARVNVEMNAAPSVDLNKALSEIRKQYESLMERNLREVEKMFLERTAELDREVSSRAEQLQSVNKELIHLKRSVQTLEIELQTELSLKSAMEDSLAEMVATFVSKLSQLQGLVNNTEAHLAKVLSDHEWLNYEYRLLVDQKTHLEKEIATYRQLLNGHNIQIPSGNSSKGFHHTRC